jgi:sec-independent protein translocase protein TatA
MPGFVGWQGLLVIGLIALVVFGPKRLPEIGRSLGGGLRELKDSISRDDDDRDLELPEDDAETASAHAR